MVPEFSSVHLLTQAVRMASAALGKGRDIGDVVDDLRKLRFSDDGILSLIDAILNGSSKDYEALGRKLRDFNDKEWEVADAAARIVQRCERTSNVTHREIELIGWRKPAVRAEIQATINGWGQPGKRVSKAKLKKLRDQISDLNKAIDEVEDALLHGRRR
jgi:hypothetical protein